MSESFCSDGCQVHITAISNTPRQFEYPQTHESKQLTKSSTRVDTTARKGARVNIGRADVAYWNGW